MMNTEVKYTEIELSKLVSYSAQPHQTCEGARLEQLKNSIERTGLQSPIIVRPTEDGNYEILSGHNRVKAFRELGRDTIPADVRENLSDEQAEEIFFDTNLNQQAFSDWKYEQKFQAIRYIDKLVKENSQQGKRTDLAALSPDSNEDGTCVQSGHKSRRGKRNPTTRDKMANRLGISTATFSKFRSILKLSDGIVDQMISLLDRKLISFEVAYRLSLINSSNIKIVLKFAEKYPDDKIDLDKLKALPTEKELANAGKVASISDALCAGIFVSRKTKEPSDFYIS